MTLAAPLPTVPCQDSIGGVLTCVCFNVPVGLGEPCFDKLGARLAAAMMSLPAAKGFELGSGFAGCRMRGSAHNDAFVPHSSGGAGASAAAEPAAASPSVAGAAAEGLALLRLASNHCGGTLGGISCGRFVPVRPYGCVYGCFGVPALLFPVAFAT